MIQAGQHHGLLLELLAQLGQCLGVEPWLGGHLLERDGDVEPHIPGAVDRAHPPLTQPGDDAVAVLQDGASCQHGRPLWFTVRRISTSTDCSE